MIGRPATKRSGILLGAGSLEPLRTCCARKSHAWVTPNKSWWRTSRGRPVELLRAARVPESVPPPPHTSGSKLNARTERLESELDNQSTKPTLKNPALIQVEQNVWGRGGGTFRSPVLRSRVRSVAAATSSPPSSSAEVSRLMSEPASPVLMSSSSSFLRAQPRSHRAPRQPPRPGLRHGCSLSYREPTTSRRCVAMQQSEVADNGGCWQQLA